MTMRDLKIVIAGGGTGGHVIPAIAVAEEIVASQGSVRFIGVKNRLESKLVPAAGFGIDFIKVKPLKGGGLTGLAIGIGAIPLSSLQAASLLGKLSPNAVLGVGGYVAGPVVLAAKMAGIPTAILEQNATVGLTNVLLSRIADRAFVSYEETLDAFPPGRAEVTGNPVRSAILSAAKEKKSAQARSHIRIVVMGGSQGANTIDERVPAALAVHKLHNEITVLHQCGLGNESKVRAAYNQARINAEVTRFIENTAAAYRDADLVISRSGATTISELTVMGLPAVLLPYPHHADKQQEKNALPMKRAGAARVLDEKTTDVEHLAEAILPFVRDAEYRNQAARASLSLGRPQATSLVVKGLLTLAKVGR